MKKGYTTTEAIVVVAIVSLLFSIIIFGMAKKRALNKFPKEITINDSFSY